VSASFVSAGNGAVGGNTTLTTGTLISNLAQQVNDASYCSFSAGFGYAAASKGTPLGSGASNGGSATSGGSISSIGFGCGSGGTFNSASTASTSSSPGDAGLVIVTEYF
jgi:hypothetical protein